MKLFISISIVLISLQLEGQITNPFNIPGRSTNKTPIIDVGIDSTLIRQANVLDSDTTPKILSNTPAIVNKTVPASHNPFDIRSQQLQPDLKPTGGVISILNRTKDIQSSSKDTNVIVLIYSIVMLIILTLTISMDKMRFRDLMKSSLNSNYLRTLYRETKAWSNGQGILLYVFFILNAAFATWLLTLKLNSSLTQNLFLIGGTIILCYSVRHVTLWALVAIYPVGSEVGLHNFSIGIHNMVLGIFLLPFIMAIEFLPGVSYQAFLMCGGVIFLLIYSLRQAKGLMSCIGMRDFNPFYFFIYLCAIEIAPFLVGYKMMIGAL